MEVIGDRHVGPAGRVSLGERGRSVGQGGGGMVDERTLAEALAILVVDLFGVLPVLDRKAALERLANRLDDQGRTPGGSEAAALLGQVGAALMQLEANITHG